MADYPKLREWAERALDQGDGVALYQQAAKEAIELLKDKDTWDSTARFLLRKLEEAEAEIQVLRVADGHWTAVKAETATSGPISGGFIPTAPRRPLGSDLTTELSLRGYYRVDI